MSYFWRWVAATISLASWGLSHAAEGPLAITSQDYEACREILARQGVAISTGSRIRSLDGIITLSQRANRIIRPLLGHDLNFGVILEAGGSSGPWLDQAHVIHVDQTTIEDDNSLKFALAHEAGHVGFTSLLQKLLPEVQVSIEGLDFAMIQSQTEIQSRLERLKRMRHRLMYLIRRVNNTPDEDPNYANYGSPVHKRRKAILEKELDRLAHLVLPTPKLDRQISPQKLIMLLSFHEFFADLMAVLTTGDPKANASASNPYITYDINDRDWSRIPTKREEENWTSRDEHVLLASLGPVVWQQIDGQDIIEHGPRFYRTVYEALAPEIRSLWLTTQPLNWPALNRNLMAKLANLHGLKPQAP